MKLKSPVDLVPILVDVEGINASRQVEFRIDQFDRYENLISSLDGVQTGGTLSWSAQSSVHGSGTIPVNDIGQEIDWLNDRLRPVIITSNDNGEQEETPLGVFLPAAPVSSWKNGNRSWDVEMLDKTSILDTDVMTDANGNAITYALHKGTNVIEIVKAILADSGEVSPAILSDPATLSSDTTWEVTSTKLQIVNDLLDAANYFSLWCDGYGQYQATKYQAPSARTPIYSMSAPFTAGKTSWLSPEWSNDHDIYDIPNRYVASVTGDEDDEGMSSVATNVDPDSPFSYPSRGRWITKTDDAAEATDQAALDAYAERMLNGASSVSNKVTVSHIFLPRVIVNAVVRFSAGDMGSVLTTITNTEITMDPESLVKTDLLKVMA